jgi:hypothetical protein
MALVVHHIYIYIYIYIFAHAYGLVSYRFWFGRFVMEHDVFRDLMPCGPCKNGRFGGTVTSIMVNRISKPGAALAVAGN